MNKDRQERTATSAEFQKLIDETEEFRQQYLGLPLKDRRGHIFEIADIIQIIVDSEADPKDVQRANDILDLYRKLGQSA